MVWKYKVYRFSHRFFATISESNLFPALSFIFKATSLRMPGTLLWSTTHSWHFISTCTLTQPYAHTSYLGFGIVGVRQSSYLTSLRLAALEYWYILCMVHDTRASFRGLSTLRLAFDRCWLRSVNLQLSVPGVSARLRKSGIWELFPPAPDMGKMPRERGRSFLAYRWTSK